MTAPLAAEQQALLAALWAPDAEIAIKLIAPHAALAVAEGSLGPQSRLWRGLLAYRSHGRELAVRALQGAYPVLVRLLDQDNFAPLARAFWQAHPPQCGDLARWGEALPAFVQGMPQLASEPFLADVARVEWAMHCASTAADAQADIASLALLTTHDAPRVTLCLSPGMACVASPWPVVSVIAAHAQMDEPDLQQAAQRLRASVGETAMVWRQGFQPRVREAWPDEASVLMALQAGLALDQALAAAPGLDFSTWLATAVQTGLVTGARAL